LKQDKSLHNSEEPMVTIFYREDRNMFVFYSHSERAYWYEYEKMILGLKYEEMAIDHSKKLTYIGILD
jgi:hypothetical protein